MKLLLSAVFVLGMAVAFGLCEPVPASSQPLALDEVELVSEQLPDLQSLAIGWGKNGGGRYGQGTTRRR